MFPSNKIAHHHHNKYMSNRQRQVNSASVLFTLCIWFLLSGFLFFTPTWHEINRRISEKFPNVRNITIEQLQVILQERSPLLLDVRSEEEFSVSSLQHAVNISDPAKVTGKKSAEIIVFCSVGYRSARFVDALQKKGFSNAVNLQGSLFAWANKGLPVFHGKRLVHHVHPYDSRWGKLLDERLHSFTPVLDTE